MKVILREFYRRYKRKTVVIDDFKKVIEDESGIDMTEIFNRYVFGKNVVQFDDDLESRKPTIQGHKAKTEDDMPLPLEEVRKLQ